MKYIPVLLLLAFAVPSWAEEADEFMYTEVSQTLVNVVTGTCTKF